MKQTTIVWKHKVNCNKLLYKYSQEISEKGWFSQDFHFKVSVNCYFPPPAFLYKNQRKISSYSCKNNSIFVEDTCPLRSIAVPFLYLNIFILLPYLNCFQKNIPEWIPFLWIYSGVKRQACISEDLKLL